MQFSIRHAIRGRVRLHVPVLQAPSPLAESLLTWLKERDWVKTVRVNYDCASLIVEYEPEAESKVGELLSMLRAASLESIELLLKILDPTGSASAVGARRAHSPAPAKFPLLLPTVSLALSFYAAPFSRIINIPLMLYNAVPIFKRAWHVWSTEHRLNVDFL
ncbi:MAG: hypothetical protein JO002_08265, partial [Burkholderiaceae bacterium]|nr:hypothetical protein [Burkholderiaceae bacterium]